ncbi:MAG: tetratricopeptide repeat protein [Deltaproteobacteria bacterium]|nr:tetratricopeptide repeat protein [Deltaproteobacteria bacterium]
MAASRFECPRCQTVFVKDIGDAAFVECPSCGALALPAGDATEGMLGRAVSGSHPNPVAVPTASAPSQPSAPATSEPGAAPAGGIFAALLEDSAQRIEIPPAALASSLDSPTAPAGYDLPRTAEPAADPGAKAPPDVALDVDWNKDLGDFDFPSLPQRTVGPGSDGPTSPFSTPVPPMQQLPREARDALSRMTGSGSGEGAASRSGEGDAEGSGEGDPTAPGGKDAPWSALSDEAFGDLERAFDDLALKPPVRRSGGLSPDEQRLLRGAPPPRGKGKPPPMRKKAGDDGSGRSAPPVPTGKKGGKGGRPRPTHFELSDETRRAAFVARTSEGRTRPHLDQGPALPPEPAESVAVGSRATASSSGEETDLVRERKERPARPVPSLWKGLSAPVVIGLILLAITGGSALGAFVIAPQPKPASTPRARAELKLANGNRFYDQGRFDDALGEFRAALTIDPTFSIAHRAKGTALAKLQRFDEAQTSYTEYLRLEPGALDAVDVKAAVERRGPPPTPDGG